jgi:hypothetical protein
MKKELYPLLVAISAMLLTTSLCAQWVEKNNSLWGGRGHAFAVDGDNIFVGTEGGVFLSSNNGASWTPRSTGLTSLRIRALAIIGSNIFAATYGEGVFHSTNNGVSWTAVNTGLINKEVWALTVIGSNIFAGTHGHGVFLSTNNGASWTQVNTGLVHNSSTAYYIYDFAVSGSNLFVGTYLGVFRSTNNGTSWTEANIGLTNMDVSALAVSGGNIYAGTGGGGVFLSTNNGANWNAVNTGLTNQHVNTLLADGTNLYAGTNNRMFLSTNNGSTWTAINNGLESSISVGVYSSVAKGGGNIFIGMSGGLFHSSDNGANWTAVNTGITSATVWTLLSNENSIFAGTSSGSGLFVLSSNGDSWQPSNSGLSFPLMISSAKIGNNLFVGGAGVFLSTNNGVTWSSVSTGLTNMGVRSLAASGVNIFAGTSSGGVFLSDNNGASWTAVNMGLTETNIQCLAASGGNVFAGTYQGLFRSTSNGTSWTLVGSTEMQTSNYIISVAVNGNTVFAATYEDGLYRSLDNGTSWAKVLDEDDIHLLILDDGSIFGGNRDVFVSTDNGANWVVAGTGLPKVTSSSIYSLTVSDSHLFAGTLFKGVWSRPLSEFPIPQPNVTITSFAPASGQEGTSVTITGTDFSVTPANNTVKFNGTVAMVTASTATSITTTVPAGATTGPIVVTRRGVSAASSTNFTVITPEINIKQSATNIASASTFGFGNQLTNVAATSLIFTIENTGVGTLNLSGTPKISISGANTTDFIVTQSATSATVATGSTTTFSVSFSPINPSGTKIAQLNIANNDIDENPYIINLTGNALSCIDPPKPTITQVSSSDFTSSTLTSTAAQAGGTYQWFNSGAAIANATSQSYTTSAAGTYTVRINVPGGCSATSDPFVIVVTVLETPITKEDFSIYPNPANDWLTLKLGQMPGKKNITIYQAMGNQMAALETLGNEVNLYMGDYPAGMFILKVSTSNSVGVVKFIKK